MKSISRKLRFRLFLAASLAVLAGAWAQASNPAVGTWKLNLAKSKFKPGPAPKNITVKIEPAGEGLKVTAEIVDAEGKPMATEYTANYDGKDYPLKGSTVADTVTLKRIDARTSLRTDKRDGKVVQTFKRVMAKDGKSFTVTNTGKDAAGKPVHNVVVFEKQ